MFKGGHPKEMFFFKKAHTLLKFEKHKSFRFFLNHHKYQLLMKIYPFLTSAITTYYIKLYWNNIITYYSKQYIYMHITVYTILHTHMLQYVYGTLANVLRNFSWEMTIVNILDFELHIWYGSTQFAFTLILITAS